MIFLVYRLLYGSVHGWDIDGHEAKGIERLDMVFGIWTVCWVGWAVMDTESHDRHCMAIWHIVQTRA